MTFGNLDNAKYVWDMLAQRYNTNNLAQRFQTVTKLHRMRQEPGQSITNFYSQMTHLWNQLALCEREWRDKDDAADYIAFRDSLHLAKFFTTIRDEFENTRASLLHCSPLPSWKVLSVNSSPLWSLRHSFVCVEETNTLTLKFINDQMKSNRSTPFIFRVRVHAYSSVYRIAEPIKDPIIQ
jgi:hypothetical protein